MIITGIDHVVLRVRDLERAERFYTEVLGCSVAHRQDALGLVHLRAGTSLIDLVSIEGVLSRGGGAAPMAEGHNLDHLCLRVADFDVETIRSRLVSRGIAVGEVGVRFGSSGEGPSIYLKDSEGNGLELRA